jgi:hypothetical protein
MKKQIFYTQKFSENSNSLSLIKKSLITSIFTLLFLVFLHPIILSAQECSFTLTAQNNIESVNKEGRIYYIQIQNNSKEDMSLNLSVLNKNSEKNPDNTDSTDNVKLNARILNAEGEEIKGKVSLKSNELLKLQVKVTVPENTPYGHWNNTLLRGTSDKCNDYSTSLTLYTFIPNPEEN